MTEQTNPNKNPKLPPGPDYFREPGKQEMGNNPSIRTMMEKIVEKTEAVDMKKETDKLKKPWKFPFAWKSKANEAAKKRDMILVFYLNIKGEIEKPMSIPIYSGNMVIIRNKVYEVDPRAMWTLKIGAKSYRCLIIKEIDRRPVTNLDLDEIKKRGDATDSDEFLIKAALRAQPTASMKSIPTVYIVIGIIVVVGILIFLFTR